MEFHRLISADVPLFHQAFALYQASFPQHEQRPLAKQKALMPDLWYHFDVLLQDGQFAGILLSWALSGCVYIEHFAIDAGVRGQSLGSQALTQFCQDAASTVVLEIDPPIDAISVRREHFYTRLGFHANPYEHHHPAYQAQFPPHRLIVMSYPAVLTSGGYEDFSHELADTVMVDAKS